MQEVKEYIINEIDNIIDYQNDLLATFDMINDLQFIKQEYLNSCLRLYELKKVLKFIESKGSEE